MIVEETCDPIGVAPELTLSGTLAPADGARVIAGSRLRAVSPAGKRSEVPLSDDGVFVLDVTPGRWRLELAMQGGTVSREISVGAYAVLVSSPNADRDERPPLPQPVRAGFDGLTPSDTLYEVPNGYLGLNWTNLIATHHKFYRGDGYINATVSSEYMAYNSSGHPANVWSEQPFDFVGTHLGVAWWHGEGHDIVIRGWRGDRIVYTDRVRARTAGPVYFDADYRAVTRVDFLSEGYGQVVLDDADFRLGG